MYQVSTKLIKLEQQAQQLQAAVTSLDPSQISTVITEITRVKAKKIIQANRGIIYIALAEPKALKLIVNLFESDEFKELLKQPILINRESIDLFDAALASNLNSFCMLMKLYSGQTLIRMLSATNEFDVCVLHHFCNNLENFKLLFDLVPPEDRLSFLKIKSGVHGTVFSATQNPEVKNFIIQLFPKPWQNEVKINAILLEATDLYLLAGTLALYTDAMKQKFQGIHKQLSLFYSAALYNDYTEEHITNFENNMKLQVNSEYRGIYTAGAWVAGFFTSLLSVEQDESRKAAPSGSSTVNNSK